MRRDERSKGWQGVERPSTEPERGGDREAGAGWGQGESLKGRYRGRSDGGERSSADDSAGPRMALHLAVR